MGDFIDRLIRQNHDLRARLREVEAELDDLRTDSATRQRDWITDWGNEHSHCKDWENRAQGDEQCLAVLAARLAAVEALCDEAEQRERTGRGGSFAAFIRYTQLRFALRGEVLTP